VLIPIDSRRQLGRAANLRPVARVRKNEQLCVYCVPPGSGRSSTFFRKQLSLYRLLRISDQWGQNEWGQAASILYDIKTINN